VGRWRAGSPCHLRFACSGRGPLARVGLIPTALTHGTVERASIDDHEAGTAAATRDRPLLARRQSGDEQGQLIEGDARMRDHVLKKLEHVAQALDRKSTRLNSSHLV